MWLYISFHLIWYATSLLSEKKFWHLGPIPEVEDVCKYKMMACMLLYVSSS